MPIIILRASAPSQCPRLKNRDTCSRNPLIEYQLISQPCKECYQSTRPQPTSTYLDMYWKPGGCPNTTTTGNLMGQEGNQVLSRSDDGGSLAAGTRNYVRVSWDVLPGKNGDEEGYRDPGLALVMVVLIGPRRSARILAWNTPNRLQPHHLPLLLAGWSASGPAVSHTINHLNQNFFPGRKKGTSLPPR